MAPESTIEKIHNKHKEFCNKLNVLPISIEEFEDIFNRKDRDTSKTMNFISLHGNLFYNYYTRETRQHFSSQGSWIKGVTMTINHVVKVGDTSMTSVHGPSMLVDAVVSLYIGAINLQRAIGAKAVMVIDNRRIAIIYTNDGSRELFYLFDKDKSGQILIDMLNALNDFHSLGFIHNDVKAENFIMTPVGMIKIIDYGTASIASGVDETSDYVCGTMEYTHPLCWIHSKTSRWTDLFSLVKNIMCMITNLQLVNVTDDHGQLAIEQTKTSFKKHMERTRIELLEYSKSLFKPPVRKMIIKLFANNSSLFKKKINNQTSDEYIFYLNIAIFSSTID